MIIFCQNSLIYQQNLMNPETIIIVNTYNTTFWEGASAPCETLIYMGGPCPPTLPFQIPNKYTGACLPRAPRLWEWVELPFQQLAVMLFTYQAMLLLCLQRAQIIHWRLPSPIQHLSIHHLHHNKHQSISNFVCFQCLKTRKTASKASKNKRDLF